MTTETKLKKPIKELLQGTLEKRLKASLKTSLHDVFGIDALRPGQEEVIRSVLDGRDTLAVMPTGAGKSLCYQLPALQLGGLTLVVSPLISLMKDQSDKLRESGIAAVALHSGLSAEEERQAIRDIDSGDSRFLFLTPERLAKADFVEMLNERGKPEIQLIVIDEAHCISQWGHDFRPAFVEMLQSIKALGRPPVLALTATATPVVIKDILRELDMKDARVINTGVYRDNLVFAVEQLTNPREKRARLLERIQSMQGTGIVYCSTVAECNAVHAELLEAGIEAERYNGKMPASERTAAQDAFMENRCRVMVATNAFGMGIDKPDIRFVIHHQMPGSLESYYQEAGRAGRDGGEAHCILLFELKDKQVQQFFLSGKYPSTETLTRCADAIQKLVHDNDRKTIESPIEALHEALPDIGVNKLRTVLSVLKDMRMIRHARKGGVTVLNHAASHDMLEAAQRFTFMAAHDRDVLERMIGYAQSGQCRWRILLDYFHAHLDAARVHKAVSSMPDELDGGVCCKCDNCVSPPAVVPGPREHRVSDAKPKPVSKTWNAGDEVQVRKYGAGRVEMMSGDRVAVSFPDGETRTFIARYVKPKAAKGRQIPEFPIMKHEPGSTLLSSDLSYEAIMLAPRGWVPNNSRLPVLIYRRAIDPSTKDLGKTFEALFARNEWPPQWRDSIFDYHHFHSTAHEALAVISGKADVIIGGPGGDVIAIEAGDVLLLPAGTGHCLQSTKGRFQVVGAYPQGQQWDIRRDALQKEEIAVMEALPFPRSDPVGGAEGPLLREWN